MAACRALLLISAFSQSCLVPTETDHERNMRDLGKLTAKREYRDSTNRLVIPQPSSRPPPRLPTPTAMPIAVDRSREHPVHCAHDADAQLATVVLTMMYLESVCTDARVISVRSGRACSRAGP
jgi:hypothetical protein